MALGALIIKERLNCSDEEHVEQVRENPYLQFFLGLEAFQQGSPFEASMMVHFRKRITAEMLCEINETLVAELRNSQATVDDTEPPVLGNLSDAQTDRPEPVKNQGKLLLDATCAPADITYPTDPKLLNESRKKSETLIDVLHQQRPAGSRKPRTYRKKAHRHWLSFSKLRRPSHSKIRAIKRKLLGYLTRNIKHLDQLIDEVGLCSLNKSQYKSLLVIREICRQQQEMFDQNKQRIDHRIVSLSQPHVRPIVRGKAGKNVEFGAKLSASLDQGFFFLDRISWNNFNESTQLISQVETYRQRHAHYPESLHVDKIYRTQANLAWCKTRNIRLSGPKPGRPLKESPENHQMILQNRKQAHEDELASIPIEGKFGQGKRRFGLDRVMSKLALTSQSAIALTFLVINLEKGLRLLFLFLFFLKIWVKNGCNNLHSFALQQKTVPLIT